MFDRIRIPKTETATRTVLTSTEKRPRMRPEGVPLKKYMVALMRPYIDNEAEWKMGLEIGKMKEAP